MQVTSRAATSVRKLDRDRSLERSAVLLAATGLTAAADRLAGRLSLATTYLDEAERCTEVLALDDGHAVARGAPDAIIAGVRGQLYRTEIAGPRDRSWRRGGGWQVWDAEQPPVNATAIEPDLEDAVVIALLARAQRGFRPQTESARRQRA